MLAQEDPGQARSRRPIVYVIPVAGLMLVALVGVLSLLTALSTVSRPFAGFFFYPNGLVSTVQRERWPGPLAGLRAHDRILAIDGVPVKNGRALREQLLRRPVGAEVELTVESRRWIPSSPPERRTVRYAIQKWTPADFAVTFALPWSIGAFYLLMGAVVFWIKRTRVAALMLGLCGTMSVFYLTTFDANTTFYFKRVWELFTLIGPISFHLFAYFPEERRRLTRSGLVYLPYLAAFVLIGVRQYWLDDPAPQEALALDTTAFHAIMFVLDMAVLGRTWARSRDPVVRNKVKVIIVGVLLSTTVGLVWAVAARVRPSVGSLESAMWLSALFPVLMAYAVLKQNLFDLDRVVKASLIYGGASALVIALYFVAVAAVSVLSQYIFSIASAGQPSTLAFNSPVVAVLSTLLVALAFHPLRLRTQRLVDRLFFRRELDLEKAFREFTQKLPQVSDVGELGRHVAENLGQLLRVDGAALLVVDRRRGVLRVAGIWGKIGKDSLPFTERLEARLLSGELLRTADLLREPVDEATRDAWLRLSAERLLPLVVKQRLVGLVALGPRPGGEELRPLDERLLESVLGPAAIAAENAVLYTERAQSERLAALGQVAAVIVHEIKNPIGIIKVSISTIKKKLRAGEAGFELATFIEQEVERMNRTIGKILSFARPQEPTFTPCDVNAVIDTTLRIIEPELEAAGIRLTRDLEEGIGSISADQGQLQQVLLNLLLNAKAAMEEAGAGGELRVRTRRSNGHAALPGAPPLAPGSLQIVVEDTGPGMDEATRERIFQPFFSTRAGGTGLGLPIVKQIVEEHRGAIQVESRPGEGSRFVITLPA